MSDDAVKLTYNGQSHEFPVITGVNGEKALDISGLYSSAGLLSFDPGFANTAICRSEVTYVDGEKGILRYRGYPIEYLAEKHSFIETAQLLIFGELPNPEERQAFSRLLSEQELLHEGLLHQFESFPLGADPMPILSAALNALGSYHHELYDINSGEEFRLAAAKIVSKVRTIAAFSYRKSQGLPFMYPDPMLPYCGNFLHMMFSLPYALHLPSPEAVRALNVFMITHADHEQNCSTSAMRMLASTGTNLFTSLSAAVCALWGRLHGGANAQVISMLKSIRDGHISIADCLERVKKKEFRLMGFGHRIYKNFDPRAGILKETAQELLESLAIKDDIFSIAQELEYAALNDDYFKERRLYPNVDFYSGIILRALNIPTPMFPVMFAMGRIPGWIAHWKEEGLNPVARIYRPHQIYVGPPKKA